MEYTEWWEAIGATEDAYRYNKLLCEKKVHLNDLSSLPDAETQIIMAPNGVSTVFPCFSITFDSGANMLLINKYFD